MLATILVILGFLFLAAGVVGCVIPVIPGPTLALASLVILSMALGWGIFGGWFWFVMIVLCVVVSVVDSVFPALGAKKYGAGKYGIWGSIIGLIVGIFIAPPITIFLGAFVGAVVGEVIAGAGTKKALLAGWGIFVGNMAAIALKLGYVFTVIFFYIKELF